MNLRSKEKNVFNVNLNKWDTDFFNKKIGILEFSGRTNIPKNILIEMLDAVILEAVRNSYQYLVIAENKGRKKLKEVICAKGFKLCDASVDLKINLSAGKLKKLDHDFNSGAETGFAKRSDLKELKEIAEKSFTRSRFYNIKFAKKKDVDRYHYVWVRNLVEGRYSKVMVIKKDKRIMGFLGFTLDRENRSSRVVLIATRVSCRGKGYGGTLLEAYFKYVYGLGIEVLYVRTQMENEGARKFYTKNGYKEYSFDEKYHIYL